VISGVRRWAVGMGLAGSGAIAAVVIGATGAPSARADVIDDLMMQAEGDLNDAAIVYSGVDAALLPAKQAGDIGTEVSALQGEAGLVSQIQAQQDALPEALQSNSQLVGADNQLATASGDLLSAMNAYVNDVDAGDYVTGYATTLSSYLDRLDFAYAEAFQFLPAVLNSEFTTLFVGFPNVEPISPPTDIVTGADSLAALASAVTGTTSADLLSGADITSFGDLASGLDPVSAVDPSMFADLLSSIGL
jgi:hypothetical protein